MLTDSKLSQQGYHDFVITEDRLYVVMLDKATKMPSSSEPDRCIALSSIASVERTSETPQFFSNRQQNSRDLMTYAQHIRVRFERGTGAGAFAQAGASAVTGELNFFSFYEDTQLYHTLLWTWLFVRTVVSQYSNPVC